MSKVRIAHLAGPNATITNIPPLVTSNKARRKAGLPPLTDLNGNPSRYDAVRPQRLAAPTTVYVEQFSAHPLETDSAHLYGPPDGYVSKAGEFSETRKDLADKPVYKVELLPEDGLYLLPYMAMRADGQPWDMDGYSGDADRAQTRQPFFPDGSRVFEEIDRIGISRHGRGSLIADIADIDFFRVAPSGGYTKGASEAARTDVGDGDIAPERAGQDYFPYRPRHLRQFPTRATLADITNRTQSILSTGRYEGAIWTQHSACIEETVYWFNLALDVTIPVCGTAAQRYQGMVSNDGPKNIVDAIDYIRSKVWRDDSNRNRAGVVLLQEQQIFAARDVTKGDARPGGYVMTGGCGGVLGTAGGGGGATLRYVPATKHTYCSDVRMTLLPRSVDGTVDGRFVAVPIKDDAGRLLPTAVPDVSIVKDCSYSGQGATDEDDAVDILALLKHKSQHAPLGGFVIEGASPYGRPVSTARARALSRAVFSGFPVVQTGRGNTAGFAEGSSTLIAGSNLTSTKARLLLMLCIMKFGMLRPASDPARPTREEIGDIESKVKNYQAVFASH